MIRSSLTRALVVVTVLAVGANPARAQAPAAPSTSIDPKAILESLERAFVSVAERVMPAVVHIDATQKEAPAERVPGREPRDPRTPQEPRNREQAPERRDFERRFREFFGEDFERFFRQRPPEPRESRRSQGSGVIVERSGVILTNNHLIERAEEIEVRLGDKRRFKAKVVGRDPKTDLAVLKIDGAEDFPVAELADGDRLRIGQWAVAVGNPFGLDRTVTVGIVSATGRHGVGVATYESFIQTDAAINPGNSGGPLVNLEGKVIGINTAIVSVGQGIGFAIPVAMIRRVLPQLLASGRVTRGWLGVQIQALTVDLAPSFGVKEGDGVLVADVMPGTPAEAAGLRNGDVITDVDGQKTPDVPDLQRLVADLPPGTTAQLTVLRDGQPRTVPVKIGEMPADDAVASAPSAERWGLTVQPITPDLARQFNLASADGLLVSDVEDDTPAARAGIRPGDVILEVNRRGLKDLRTFEQALRGDRDLLLFVKREGRSLYLVMKAESR